MSEAIKLTPVTTAAGQTEGRADWVRLPKFILGSDCHEALEGASQWGDSEYVIHLHSPRFVGEVLHDDEGTTIKPHWIDEPEPDAIAIASLMREAGGWYSLVRS